jgi:DNA adenine methylase
MTATTASDQTPFRYPGGKAFMFPAIVEHLESKEMSQVKNYAEPYCGGAGAAIRLLSQDRVERIFLNDFDWRVYAAWKSMLDESSRFLNFIEKVPINISTWYKMRDIVEGASSSESDPFQVGTATFYLNRTNRSGIIVGAGPIGGYDQIGNWKIDARFPRQGLANRISWLAQNRHRIALSNRDGLSFLKEMAPNHGCDTFYFIDPPYVKAGSRLYMNSMTESIHRSLAKYLVKERSDIRHWMVTYDDDPLIRHSYADASIDILSVKYSLQKKRMAGELLILPARI